jgi:cation diffusion facilitator family transporter
MRSSDDDHDHDHDSHVHRGHGHGHGHGGHQRPIIKEASPPCPYIPDLHGPDGDPAVRARDRAVRRVFWITLVLNFVVAIAKGIYSWTSGSVTLGADAFHSVLDGSANVLALVGMHLSTKPASAAHPYGRRKIELLAAVGIGVLIAVSLVEVASAAIHSLVDRRPGPDIGWTGFAVVLASMAIDLVVARYEAAQGRALKSPLLTADAHHTQSDLYASGAVLVSFVATGRGLWWADGVCGLVVVLMVGRVAWEVLRENVPSLLDVAVLDPTSVHEICQAVEGVHGIHRVRSRGTPWAVELDLHMQVAAEMKVEHAHIIANKVEAALKTKLPQLSDVVVHIEPMSSAPEQTHHPHRDHSKNP